MVAPADGNYGDAKHAPTDGVAIPVVASITVKALHSVINNQVEERLEGAREAVEECKLPIEGKLCERSAMS